MTRPGSVGHHPRRDRGAAVTLAALARDDDAPARNFPSFDVDLADTAIVVARVSAGGELPDVAGCDRPDVICMHAPFWFGAQGLQTIVGKLDGPVVNVSTERHDSMRSCVRAPSTQLLLLKSHGGEVCLPLWQFERLHTRRDGELFLVSTPRRLPNWLPCAGVDLFEPIVAPTSRPTCRASPIRTPARSRARRSLATPSPGASRATWPGRAKASA